MWNLRRPAFFAACALAALAAVAAVNPPRAAADDGGNKYAAIAYSESTGQYGYTYGYDDQCAAENDAIANSGACDARVVVEVENGWAALALGPDGTWGAAWSTRSLADAERMALGYTGNPGCSRIAVWAAGR
jgi:hypothetical protein